MIAQGLAILSWVMLISGATFAVIGAIGILRMPDFYTRIHAASVTDTAGVLLIFGGLLCQAPDLPSAIRLVLVLSFLVVTSPTASHALAKAAKHAGIEPVVTNNSK